MGRDGRVAWPAIGPEIRLEGLRLDGSLADIALGLGCLMALKGAMSWQ